MRGAAWCLVAGAFAAMPAAEPSLVIVPADPKDVVVWKRNGEREVIIEVTDRSGIGRATIRGWGSFSPVPKVRFILGLGEIESFTVTSGDARWEGSRRDPGPFLIKGAPGSFELEIPADLMAKAGDEIRVQWIDWFR